MYAVLYFMIGCAVAGAIGMAIGSRKVNAETRRQRWIKYFVYILITIVVTLAILYDKFYLVAAIIMLVGLYEMIFALAKARSLFFKYAAFLIYTLISAGFLLFSTHFNIYFLLAIYLQVLMFDAFSQIAGQIFGKHPLVPYISPTKTVEGFIGGFIVCIITAMAVAGIIKVSLLVAFLFGVVTAISALCGDLLASWVKRKMGIKDYSRLLPGQGGVLDRYDSFIAVGFVYFSLSQTVLDNFFSAWLTR